MSFKVGVAGSVAVLLSTFLTGPANASEPEHRHHQSEIVVWSRLTTNGGSTFQLVASDPGGHHVHGVTHPATGVQDVDASVSPDGRWIAFERDFTDGTAAIMVVSTHGGDERRLGSTCVDPCGAEIQPSWSPDSRRVLFTRTIAPFTAVNDSAVSAVLWSVDLAGADLRRVSQSGIDGVYEDYGATFAPDGYVVFIRLRNTDLRTAVFRMDANGRNVRQLTDWPIHAELASVSPARCGPSRNLVVFESTKSTGASTAVATVDAAHPTGSFAPVRYLTPTTLATAQNFNPNWSPDGRQIVFTHFNKTPSLVGDIWTMRWNGAYQRPFSTSPLFEFRPAWGRLAH